MASNNISPSNNKEIKQNLFENIKSDYFLEKTFELLKKNGKLKIIKYNKKIQKRLNLSINDYKDYTELYSEIEIEICLIEERNGKFITYKGENESFYHIYFDDNKEEIKRNFFKKDDVVKKIKLIIDYQVTSFCDLFKNCRCIKSVIFKKFSRKNITNMRSMFSGCVWLKSVNLANFNTINVTDMSYMFRFCGSLQYLDLSCFNTTNVTNMSFMFTRCSELIIINMFNFNTNSVKDMSSMFYECNSLDEIHISNFIINKTTHVKKMFSGCPSRFITKIKSQINNIKDEAFN